jgi:hypothetical protein
MTSLKKDAIFFILLLVQPEQLLLVLLYGL